MKNRKLITLTILLLPILISACMFSVIRGSGEIASETREVHGFSRVELSGVGTLSITQGDEESLKIEAEENLIPYIETRLRGETLVIGFEDGQWSRIIQPTQPIHYFLTMKDISAISISGAGRVDADHIETPSLDISSSGAGDIRVAELATDDLQVSLSGAGNCKISGQATAQRITISGAGNYSAEDLQSEETTIEISGFGGANLWVKDSLDIELSGAGSVEYFGNPHVRQTISGAGNIRQLGEK